MSSIIKFFKEKVFNGNFFKRKYLKAIGITALSAITLYVSYEIYNRKYKLKPTADNFYDKD